MPDPLVIFDAIPRTVHSSVIRLTGSVDSTITNLSFGPNPSNLKVIQLTNRRWTAVLQLESGRNEFTFQPYTTGPVPAAPERLVVYYEQPKLELHHPPTSLDGHAARLGYTRLPTETGVSFKNRLMQGASAAGAGLATIPIALATEIGFPYSRDMVRVKVERTTYNHPVATQAWIRATPSRIQFTCRELAVAPTVVRFDAGYPYYSITPSPFHPIRLTFINGQDVPASAWEFLPETNRLWLRDLDLANKDLLLSWTAINEYLYATDLAALKTAIEADGFVEFLITASDYHSSTTDADWLIATPWLPVSEDEDWPTGVTLDQPGPRFSVSEVQSFVLHGNANDYLQGGSGLGTALERWIGELNLVDRRTWATIVIGRDGLRDGDNLPIQSAFPHLMDASRGGWGTTQLNQHEEAYLNTGAPFIGATTWKSGTGQLGDLEAGVVRQEMQTLADLVEEAKIPANIIYGSLS